LERTDPIAVPSADLPRWVENTPDKRSRASIAELWAARDLVYMLVVRDIRLRYRQTSIGVVWVLLQPALSVLILFFVFRKVARVDVKPGPYFLFALTGLVSWGYFARAVAHAGEVLVNQSTLVTKVYFPRLAVPVAAAISPLLDLVISFALVVILLIVYGRPALVSMLAVPIWLVWLTATAVGVGLWLAAFSVRYRDVAQLVGPLLQVWLFASPVAYEVGGFSGKTRALYALNPMAGVIDFGRWCVLGGPKPTPTILPSVLVSAVVLIAGVSHFRRVERSFADVI
jgi:ABC-2 type transport system permease protein/lipopolysaccharide transport system permease protein